MLSLFFVCSMIALSQQCCVPPEWEADESYTVATKAAGKVTPIITKVSMKVFWQAPMRRFFVSGSYMTNGTITKFKVLNDYISHVKYSVESGKCTVSKIPESFQSKTCTPASAKTSPPVFVGLGQLQITPYTWQIGNNTVYFNYADGCVPVSFTTYGIENGARFMMSGSYTNLTVGLKDKSVFNLPKECVGTSLNTIG